MTHFRYRWRKLGDHIHVNVWTGPARELTHARNGTLVFRDDEWEDFVQLQRDAAGAGDLSAVEILREPYGGGDAQ
jgi:hypothetical protein